MFAPSTRLLSPFALVGLVALLVGGVGVAVAAIPSSGGEVHACYDPRGNLRVIDPDAGDSCLARETPLVLASLDANGKVARAVHADTADSADHATEADSADTAGHADTADSAANAEQLDGLDSSAFLQSGTAAGGDLAGTFPNPSLGTGVVGPEQVGTIPTLRITSATGGHDVLPRTFTDIQFDATSEPGFLGQQWETPPGAFTAGDTTPVQFNAPIAGVYYIAANVEWEPDPGERRAALLRVDEFGVGHVIDRALDDLAADERVEQQLSGLVRLEAGEPLKLEVYQDNVGSHPLTVWATLEMIWLAP